MKNMYVNVSCANLYREASYHSEIDSQVVLWEKVERLAEKDDFIRIRAEDGYEGWVSRYQLEEHGPVTQEQLKPVTVSSIKLYARAEQDSEIIREAVAGGYLPVEEERANRIKVGLPDGEAAWTDKAAIQPVKAFLPENLTAFSRTYLGIPYFWAGKTPKGMDCSGFVQLVFKLFGFRLRRDAWMQHEDARPAGSDPLKAKPAELLFFAESGERITHIAISIGKGLFIHARGMVRINSLDEAHPLFDVSLKKSFVDVRSYL